MTGADSLGRVAIGYVAKAKGVRGEVGIESLSWDSDRFAGLRRIWLERDGESDRELSIQHCRADTRGPLIKFAGIDTREAASALQGCSVELDPKWFSGDLAYPVVAMIGARVLNGYVGYVGRRGTGGVSDGISSTLRKTLHERAWNRTVSSSAGAIVTAR